MTMSAKKPRIFEKHAISINEQIALLQKRGLVISDPAHAGHVLTYIGYYHLSAYELPFQKADKSADHHLFIADTKFEDILDT